MRGFYRVVCGTAAVLISLGLLLGLIGFLMGGRVSELDRVLIPLHGSWRIGPFEMGRRGNPLYGSDTIDTVYPGTDIAKLDFELSCADVTIKTGDNFKVEARKINAKRFRTEIDGDTWEIECDMRGTRNISGDKAPVITITVPRDFVAEELDLELSMGSLEMKGLSARRSSLNTGMGEMIVKDFSSGDCDIEIGMGSLEFTGELTGNGSIDCGMGSAELTLIGDPDDYGYTASVGMGSVTVNGYEIDPEGLPPMGSESVGGIGGFATNRSWNTGAPNQLVIDCGMGSVEIGFRK